MSKQYLSKEVCESLLWGKYLSKNELTEDEILHYAEYIDKTYRGEAWEILAKKSKVSNGLLIELTKYINYESISRLMFGLGYDEETVPNEVKLFFNLNNIPIPRSISINILRAVSRVSKSKISFSLGNFDVVAVSERTLDSVYPQVYLEIKDKIKVADEEYREFTMRYRITSNSEEIAKHLENEPNTEEDRTMIATLIADEFKKGDSITNKHKLIEYLDKELAHKSSLIAIYSREKNKEIKEKYQK